MSVLHELADHFGIHRDFHDFNGQQRWTNDDTKRALLAANGVDVSSEATLSEALTHLRAEAAHRWFPVEIIVPAFVEHPVDFGLGAAWELRAWDAVDPVADGQAGDFITLPAMDPDVYDLRISVAGRIEHVRVLAAPDRLPQLSDIVPNARIWGMTAALYGLYTDQSTGLGSFADLGQLAEIAGQAGASFVGINPVHALGFSSPDTISPYSPTHRGFYNTDHIALAKVPGLAKNRQAKALVTVANGGATGALIDYPAEQTRRRAAQQQLFALFETQADAQTQAVFQAYVAEQGTSLVRFARFESLCENFGRDWWNWPADPPRTPDGERFHSWLQWVADVQLAQAQQSALGAGMPLGLYLDLSVGARRDGAESWCERDAIATGISVGAPPDQLGPDGQNWQLAAYSPTKLQALGYGPLRQVLRQTMRHAGMIRIDHVLGLNRSFWIPDDGSDGAYISQPFESLVAVIKIEAWRTNTLVVGEDLGLVPDGFRDRMQAHGFYGYSVLQYEKEESGAFRAPGSTGDQMLSCFATHDTPTLAGFEAARDIDWWEKLGSLDEAEAVSMRAGRMSDIDGLRTLGGDGTADLSDTVHRILAESPSQMICLQLDDVLGTVEAQNLPGTIDQHPNWRRRHGVSLDSLAQHPGMTRIAEMQAKHGRAAPKFDEGQEKS